MTCDQPNTDLLSPNKFKIVIHKFPNTNFFAQRVPIPTVTLGAAMQFTNRENDIKLPGDKLEYEDLIVSFLVNEDISSFTEILEWMQEITTTNIDSDEIFSDISVIMLTNNLVANKAFTFYNCFPQTVTNILLDATATEDQPLTADVIFKYSHFTISSIE